MTNEQIKEALKSNCFNVYHKGPNDSNPKRVVGVRTRKVKGKPWPITEIRTMTPSKTQWEPIKAPCYIR